MFRSKSFDEKQSVITQPTALLDGWMDGWMDERALGLPAGAIVETWGQERRSLDK